MLNPETIVTEGLFWTRLFVLSVKDNLIPTDSTNKTAFVIHGLPTIMKALLTDIPLM